MKKFYIILAILIFAIIGISHLYFSQINKDRDQSNYGLNFIVNHASVVLTFDNEKSFTEILKGQEVSDDLFGLKKSKILKALNEESTKNHKIQQLFTSEKVYIGIYPYQKDSLGLIFSIQTEEGNQERLKDVINSYKVNALNNYYKLELTDSIQIYLKIQQNTLLIANEPSIFDKDKAENKENISFASYIRKNTQYAKNTLASVFINFQTLPQLLQNTLQTKLTGELQLLSRQNAYASLNYNYNTNKLLLSGYTVINDKSDYTSLFLNQAEQKINIDLFFPESTANYSIYGINDIKSWNNDLAEWQEKQKQYANMQTDIKRINEKYRIDLTNVIAKYFNKQFANIQLENGEKIGIISIKNGEKIAQSLLDLSTEYSPEIRIFKEKNILSYYFGQAFEKYSRPFYTIIDNQLVIANYPSSLQVFLNNYKSDRLLINSASYKAFKDQISTSASILFYINLRNSKQIFGRNLNSIQYKHYQSSNGFKNYESFGYQLAADDQKFISNFILLKKTEQIPIDTTNRY